MVFLFQKSAKLTLNSKQEVWVSIGLFSLWGFCRPRQQKQVGTGDTEQWERRTKENSTLLSQDKKIYRAAKSREQVQFLVPATKSSERDHVLVYMCVLVCLSVTK